MRSVNKVILIGNLTRDPELKSTTSGQSIVSFGLATNRQWTTSNGEKRSSAEFHECVAWAKLAEICKDYLKKGMLVYVEGYLKTRSWDMEDGTRRFRTEVVLHDMIILEKRGDRDDMDYTPSDGTEMASEGSIAGGSSTTASDDDDSDDDDATAAKTEETKPLEAAPAVSTASAETPPTAATSEPVKAEVTTPAPEAAATPEVAPAAPAPEVGTGEIKADIDDDNMF